MRFTYDIKSQFPNLLQYLHQSYTFTFKCCTAIIFPLSMTKMAVKQHRKDHGHQLCKPLIEHVADGGCVSLFMHRPNRFLASKYSFFQPSRSSAESLYHCLKNVRTKSMHESLNKWEIEIWKKIAWTRYFLSGMSFECMLDMCILIQASKWWNHPPWMGIA